jgi:cytochrome c oxidase assembly factor CtaG
MQAVAALISLSDTVLYQWYAVAPRTWGLSALDDQKIGGLMMWVPGGLYLAGAIGIVFFLWAGRET